MSDEDQSTNPQLPNLSLNFRNNLQLQPRQLDGDNSLIRIGGTTNIDNSNVENIQQLGNVENLTINFTQNIIGPQQNIQVTNSRINEASTSTTANAEVFDEQKFRNYFVRVECRFKDISSKERPITEDMYDNMPIAMETTFEQLSNRSREQITQEGTTQLSQAFPIEGGSSSNRVVAIIGEPGAGKSVYLITLRSYYIKNDFFVFSLDFLSMNSMNSPIELMTFAEFLLNCACPDFPYIISTIWLCNSDAKCVFLIDGLDQAPHIINQNESNRHINSRATVSTWLSLLYLRKLMKRSKIIYTSRPSSVVQLAPSQQPDLIYKLIGFSEQSIVGVISTYNSEHAQEIVTFINSKGPNLVRFSRNPFILALIALVYKTSSTLITTETTITEIYQLAIHQLSSAIRKLRGEDGDAGQNQRGEEMVDRFYYENFIENKISFTEDDVLARNLSMEILETFTLINIDSNQFSLGLEPKQKMITPQHQNVMEFHIARYMVTVMDIERFKTVVNEEMFDLLTQDRWNMIRRFIAGLINTGNFDEGKRGIFLNKLVTELKNVVSRSMLSGVCERDVSKYRYAVLYQSSLFNDITEMNRELEFIKSSFAEMDGLNFHVKLPDAHSLYGLIYLLRHIDPHLNSLLIELSNDVKLSHFNELAEAIKSLSEKVLYIYISNMPRLHENMDKLGELIRKSKYELMLSYPPRVNIGEIEVIKQNLQSQINQLQSEEPPIIRIEHRNCSYLIRHLCYTNMTSSFIMPYLGGFTLNLMQCRNRNIFSQVENIANKYPWNFAISQQEELEILIKFLVKVKQAIIGIIELYPNSDLNWNVIRMFCNKTGQTKHKVLNIHLYNIVSSEIDIYYVRKLWPKVQQALSITYKNEISDEEVDMWVDKLEAIRSLCTECLLILKFKNLRITRLPPTNQIMIEKKPPIGR